MEKSKMLSAEPLMVNGVQETYNGDHGLKYKQTVVFENGDTGTSMTVNAQHPYSIGVEYVYEKKVNGRQGQFVSFYAIKKAEVAGQPQGDYVSFWDKPRTIHYKMKPVCYKLATRYFTLLSKNAMSAKPKEELISIINMLTETMFSFIMELQDTNQRWARIALIEIALAEAVELPVLNSIAKFEGIKEYVLEAEKCINTNAPA